MNNISYGYNILEEHQVNFSKFLANARDLTSEFVTNNDIGSISSTWVPHDITEVKMDFFVNLQEIQSSLGLNEKDRLDYLLRGYSSGTKRQFVSSNFRLVDGENKAILEIPEFQTSGSLDVYLEIFVSLSENAIRSNGAPRKSFSNVFRRKWKIILSGDGSQANVYLSDFSNSQEARNALYRIHLQLPPEFDDWPHVQQSSVVKIEVNKSIPEDVLRSKQFATLLMTDLVWLTIDKFMIEYEGINMLRNPNPNSGSFLDFAHSYFCLIFPEGDFLIDSTWKSQKPEILSKIQSLVAPTLEQNLDKLLKAFEETNG